ncbi:reverse transcriptase domain-containing protein [Tanacetum coccineum]|uniref:Reverse transcriptase domain-containing protein n=1 Tax=Tanacetum coccineum TaxID=301880 RepID=A0ABQ5B895_9ASTR
MHEICPRTILKDHKPSPITLQQISNFTEVDEAYYDPEGDILLLESFLNSDPSPSRYSRKLLTRISGKRLKVYNNKLSCHNCQDLSDDEETCSHKGLKIQKASIAWKALRHKGHKISKKGIEVDKAKINVISKLPHPTTVKGAVLGQRIEKHFRPIHYASKTMTEAETNNTTTEKEMLAVVYAFKKFRSYLIMNKSVVYTDHSASLIFHLQQERCQSKMLRWVLHLQEIILRRDIDTKGAETNAADHLSRL